MKRCARRTLQRALHDELFFKDVHNIANVFFPYFL